MITWISIKKFQIQQLMVLTTPYRVVWSDNIPPIFVQLPEIILRTNNFIFVTSIRITLLRSAITKEENSISEV